MDTVKEEGKIEGRIEGKIEGKIEVASEMKKKGLDIKFIAEITGLSEKEINAI
jgi:predicted transposase/invertase (TIGR01784 family)